MTNELNKDQAIEQAIMEELSDCKTIYEQAKVMRGREEALIRLYESGDEIVELRTKLVITNTAYSLAQRLAKKQNKTIDDLKESILKSEDKQKFFANAFKAISDRSAEQDDEIESLESDNKTYLQCIDDLEVENESLMTLLNEKEYGKYFIEIVKGIGYTENDLNKKVVTPAEIVHIVINE